MPVNQRATLCCILKLFKVLFFKILGIPAEKLTNKIPIKGKIKFNPKKLGKILVKGTCNICWKNSLKENTGEILLRSKIRCESLSYVCILCITKSNLNEHKISFKKIPNN